MKFRTKTICALHCVLIFNAYATQEQSAQTPLDINTVEQKTDSQKDITKQLDPIITKAIDFSNDIGQWFDDLFDKKQHMTFNTHIDKLGKIITAMHLGIVQPLENTDDVTILAAWTLTTILYKRAKETYQVLDAHRTSKSSIKVGNALKKIEKKLKTEQEKNKLKKAFKELVNDVTPIDATLAKKINTLESVVAENSVRTKRKGWWTLWRGLSYRLQCK